MLKDKEKSFVLTDDLFEFDDVVVTQLLQRLNNKKHTKKWKDQYVIG